MVVITGASGQLGRLVARALAERVSTSEVTLGAREPGKIANIAAQGFKTAVLDFDDPAGMRSTFGGADVMLIISSDAPNDLRISTERRSTPPKRGGCAALSTRASRTPGPRACFRSPPFMRTPRPI
jgi:NAD(P)H dehydrogenase (quinone)